MENDRYIIKRSGHNITNTKNPGQNEIREKLNIYYAQKTFVSVSIKHPWFVESDKNEKLWRLKEFVKWLFSKYNHITFFVADSLHRYNINLNSLNNSDNFEEAIQIGEIQRKSIISIIKEINSTNFSYDFINSSDIYLKIEFQDILKNVKNYFTNDEVFRNAVIKSAENYWQRKYKDGFCYLSQQQDVKLSTDFINEEIAYFAYMSKILEYRTNVYPGDFLFVFKSIDFNQYPSIDVLANQNFQTVKLKKRI